MHMASYSYKIVDIRSKAYNSRPDDLVSSALHSFKTLAGISSPALSGYFLPIFGLEGYHFFILSTVIYLQAKLTAHFPVKIAWRYLMVRKHTLSVGQAAIRCVTSEWKSVTMRPFSSLAQESSLVRCDLFNPENLQCKINCDWYFREELFDL